MKIVKFLGGLGNQMFQLALLKSLQNLYPEERILADIFLTMDMDYIMVLR